MGYYSIHQLDVCATLPQQSLGGWIVTALLSRSILLLQHLVEYSVSKPCMYNSTSHNLVSIMCIESCLTAVGMVRLIPMYQDASYYV